MKGDHPALVIQNDITWMLAECPDLWSGDEGKLSTIKIFPYMEAPSFARRASLIK